MVISALLNRCNRSLWLLATVFAAEGKCKNKYGPPVKEVHSKNFSSLVTYSGREALILFYSPTCKHCQAIAPIWEELGDKLQQEEIDVVKIDATCNKWPYHVYILDDVPTIYYKFATKDQKPIKYDGGRRLDDFIKFVSEHATQELSGWDREGRPKCQ